MTLHDLSGQGVTLSRSAVDSERFERPIDRLVVGAATAESDVATELVAALADSTADIIIARWPAGAQGCAAAAARPGWVQIPADTLVYWTSPTAALVGGPRATHFVVDSAADAEDLSGVVRRAFGGYVNHYSANPLLDPERALKGYLQWAERALQEASSAVLVVREVQGPVLAFATARHTGGDVEVELAAATPEGEGTGAYAVALASAAGWGASRGSTRLVISTQASNIRVQRRWAQLGLRPHAAYTTVHLIRRDLWDQAQRATDRQGQQ